MNARAGAPADAGARATALDPARSCIVEAPAGSGKTTLLTQRFLKLLAVVTHPESVLAITFTRKATAEMRDKIVGALRRAERGEPARDAADEATLAYARAALATDAARGWQLTRQPSRLRILTIDSLNHWLAGRLPILSRAGASLAINERPAELYARAARRTIGELDAGGALGEQLAVVLEHLDNEVDRLEPLLVTMLESRDRWLRLVMPAAGAPPDARLRAALEDALAALITQTLERLVAALPPELAAPLWRLAARAAARHPEPHPGYGRLAALVGGAALSPTTAELDAWQALTRLLLTQKAEFRVTVTKSNGFPPEHKQEKADFIQLLTELRARRGLAGLFAATAVLPPPCYDEPQWRVLVALHEVLLAAAARLAEVFATEGSVDFQAVQRAALEALGSPDEPTDLTLELDYRLQHILVDEFQDTSAAQVALLERLTGGWQAGDGRTLFLVGDPMQSIYAFREADVGLFLRVRQAGLGGIALEPLTLSANFRSRPAIVEWVNAAFTAVLPPAEDLARGAVPYSASQAIRDVDPDARVVLRILADASAEQEAAVVADVIAAERARDPTARIAILSRARPSLSALAAALHERRIAFQGVKLVRLAERAAVRDLIALTRALLHLADRIAWLACLRAPWCGLGLGSLWELAGDSPDATLWALMHDPARLARLPPEEGERLIATRAVLAGALADRGRRPLAAQVEAAWLALGGPATLVDAADLDNAETFFRSVAELETAGDLEDPVRLTAQLEQLYAAPDAGADERLQLMTVHGAKGLEWDVVVLTGLGRRTRGGEARLLHWLEFARADGGPGLVLAPHRARAQQEDRLEAWLKKIEDDRADLELGRLLYVAATRARERLFLVGNLNGAAAQAEEGADPRAPPRGTLLATLWPAIAGHVRPEAGPDDVAPARVGAGAGRAPPPRRLEPGWTPPAPEPAVVALSDPPLPAGPSEFEFEWVGAAARHVGTVVHEELERAAGESLDRGGPLAARAPLWRRRLIELGVPDEQLARGVERIERALAATRADPRGQWLFDLSHSAVASELDLSSVRGGQVVGARIDRTFVDAAGVRWIVDYKTSSHEGTDLDAFLDQEQRRYAAQLEAYADLMRARDPSHPIRLGLYFPLHAGWREWAARG